MCQVDQKSAPKLRINFDTSQNEERPQAGKNLPLGIYTNSPSALPQKDALHIGAHGTNDVYPDADGQKAVNVGAVTWLIAKWARQRLAAELLPGDRVAGCLRAIAPLWLKDAATGERYAVPRKTVKVGFSPKVKRASYKNLMHCGSLWNCPICAAQITEGRVLELRKIAKHPDYELVLVSATLSHKKTDSLLSLLIALNGQNSPTKVYGAWQQLTRGRPWERFCAEYRVIGVIKALEVTYGWNGWHPHVHALLVIKRSDYDFDPKFAEHELAPRWVGAVAGMGYSATLEHGLNVSTNAERIAEYIAKWGHEPTRDWSVEREVAKAPAKLGKRKGFTPFQLLDEYGRGNKQAGKLFQEYAAAMKGRHQLYIPPKLKELFEIAEVSDQELVERLPDDWQVVVEILAVLWREIVRLDKRRELLDVIESTNGDGSEVLKWIAALPGLQTIVEIDLSKVGTFEDARRVQPIEELVIVHDKTENLGDQVDQETGEILGV